MQSKEEWTQEYLATVKSKAILGNLKDHSGTVIDPLLMTTLEYIQSFLNQQKYEGPKTGTTGYPLILDTLCAELTNFPTPEKGSQHDGTYSAAQVQAYLGNAAHADELNEPYSTGLQGYSHSTGTGHNRKWMLEHILLPDSYEGGQVPDYLGGSDNLDAASRSALEGLVQTGYVEWQQVEIAQEAADLDAIFIATDGRHHGDTESESESGSESEEEEEQDAAAQAGGGAGSAPAEGLFSRGFEYDDRYDSALVDKLTSVQKTSLGKAQLAAKTKADSTQKRLAERNLRLLESRLGILRDGGLGSAAAGGRSLEVEPSLAHYSEESNTWGKVLSVLLGFLVFAVCAVVGAGIGAFVGGAGASVTSVATLGAFIVGDGALFVGIGSAIGSAIGLVAGCMTGKYAWPTRSGDAPGEQEALVGDDAAKGRSGVQESENPVIVPPQGASTASDDDSPKSSRRPSLGGE